MKREYEFRDELEILLKKYSASMEITNSWGDKVLNAFIEVKIAENNEEARMKLYSDRFTL